MDKNRIYYLHECFLKGTLTVAESKEWQRMVNDPQTEDQLLSMIENSWKEIPDMFLMDMPEDRSNELLNQIASQPQLTIKTVKLWPRIAIAAAIATIIFSAGLFYYNFSIKQGQTYQTAFVNDIAPGKTGATLTLASGKKIRLSDAANGPLANEAGISITKTTDGQLVYEIKSSLPDGAKQSYNTLSTAKGETYQLHLPDGSLVFLNAASSLKYPTTFAKAQTRHVSLTGEGYFEIAKDKAHPFVVESRGQKVEVLGTHFNVNAYDDEPMTKTTLLEGRVNVSSLRGRKQTQILKPGEQAVFVNDHLTVSSANLEEAIAWKDGYFRFNEEKMSSIAKKLERWYDIEIILSEKLGNKEFTGKIARNRNISRVLSIMEETNRIHFKIEGRRVTAIEK